MSGQGEEWVYEVFWQLPFGYRICNLKARFKFMEHLPYWILHRKTTINKNIGPIKFRNCVLEYHVWPKLPAKPRQTSFSGCTAYLNEGLLTRHVPATKNGKTYCDQCGHELIEGVVK